MKRVYVKEEWCLGCRLCEYWCVYSGSGEKNFPFAFDGGATPPAGMQVEEVGPIHFAVDCRHCDDPLCLKGCISGALYRDGYGAVRVDKTKCVGCHTCIAINITQRSIVHMIIRLTHSLLGDKKAMSSNVKDINCLSG